MKDKYKNAHEFNQIIEEATRRYRGDSMSARMGRLNYYGCHYLLFVEIGKEIYARIFQQMARGVDEVITEIQNFVVGRTWYW